MALLPNQEISLKALLIPDSEASKFSRKLDFLILPIVVFAIMAAVHIHFMLTAGDWDFWVDWKDRQFWITVSPVVLMIILGAIQAIFWVHFRLPIGATVCGLLLILGEWINRYFGFFLWSHFPMSLIWPATMIAGCMFLDLVLGLTRNHLMVSVFGALGYALLFPAANWFILAPFRLPMELQGSMISVADYIGFHFTRTATPEYLRIIERGTLRTFGGESTIIAAFFAGFLSMILHFMWWNIGSYISNLGWAKTSLKTSMGFHKDDQVTREEGLGGPVEGIMGGPTDPSEAK